MKLKEEKEEREHLAIQSSEQRESADVSYYCRAIGAELETRSQRALSRWLQRSA
jgi:hypothetical protein